MWIKSVTDCVFNVMCKQEDLCKMVDNVMRAVSLFHDLLSFRVCRKNTCRVFQMNMHAHKSEMNCIHHNVCGYIRLKNRIIDNCMQKIGYKIGFI